MRDRSCSSRHCSRTGFAVESVSPGSDEAYCLSCRWEQADIVSLGSSGVGESGVRQNVLDLNLQS